ncbi:MAG: hypothetical protein IJ482_06000 [Alphaproteobacteria bacterium]|nr:hypothetical protein [Alphaproteobacteria bacterium]
MENSQHLLAAGMIYLLGLVCFFGYVCQKTSWRRERTLRKIKQKVFYMIWGWSLICMGLVFWIEQLPLAFMLIGALFFFFAAWFIKEGMFQIVHAIRRRRDFHRGRRC